MTRDDESRLFGNSGHAHAATRRWNERRAFTLVELALVITIVSAMMLLGITAFTRISSSSSITRAGAIFVDQLTLARQLAISENCQIEFRIYKLPDESNASSALPETYRAIQLFTLDASKGTAKAAGHAVFLPRGVAVCASLSASSLLTPLNPPFTVAGSSTADKFVGFSPSSYSYTCFEFNPDGSTDLSTNQNWFISLAPAKQQAVEGQELPANFVTLQMDPSTGRVRIFRP